MSYKCPTCKRQFACEEFLDQHLCVLYSRVKVFTCSFCEGKYITKQYLEEHLTSCNLKSHSSIQESMMRKNSQILSSVQLFEYEICCKPFIDESALRNHLTTYHGNKPFCCEICRKGYLSKQGLNIHLISHSDVRLTSNNSFWSETVYM